MEFSNKKVRGKTKEVPKRRKRKSERAQSIVTDSSTNIHKHYKTP